MRLLLLGLVLSGLAFAQNNPATALFPGSLADDTQYGIQADRCYTTLASGIAATDTTISVTDGSCFPANEFFIVICPTTECGIGATAANGETIAIASRSTNTLTIQSTGRQWTAANAGTSTGDAGNPTHSSGEAVVLMQPAGAFNFLAAQQKAIADFIDHLSACTDAQVVGGTGSSTLECQTDDDVPESGDFGNAAELDSTGAFDGTITTADVEAELKRFAICHTLKDSTGLDETTDDVTFFHVVQTYPVTVTKITCAAVGGTATGNLQRNDGSAADIASSDLTCANGSLTTTSTLVGTEDDIAAGEWLGWDFVSKTGTPTELIVCAEVEVN